MPLKLRILFVLAEAWPLVKTGGLADVAPPLARSLIDAGYDVRLLIPGYRQVLAQFGGSAAGRRFEALPSAERVQLIRGRLPEYDIRTWLVDCPSLYDRPGGPYLDPHGVDWWDNSLRFGTLCRVAALFGSGKGRDRWKADVIHGHDWHAGLASAYCAFDPACTAATVFTVHNLAYQGNFNRKVRRSLGIDSLAFHMDGLEYYGHLSFMKAGLWYSDRITTVSPTYARQVLTEEYGCGMDGVLRHRAARLSGIMNGVDARIWDPGSDRHLPFHYSADDLEGKARCKVALQARSGLDSDPDAPVVGMIGRMTLQKGWDLLADAAPALLADGVQLALTAQGDTALEARIRDLALRHPRRVSFVNGHDEARAHLVFAGADLFAVPSRFEPSGLIQMYSQRYGTPPVVRRTGGLVDTVTDTTPATLASGTATGFFFDRPDGEALAVALRRAIELYRRDKGAWRSLQHAGMHHDFSWKRAATAYAEIYERALDDRRIRTGQ